MVDFMSILDNFPYMTEILVILSGVSSFILTFIIGRLIIQKPTLDVRLHDASNRLQVRKEYGETFSQTYIRKQLQQKGQENVKKAAALVLRGFLDQIFNNPFFRNDKIKLIFSQAGISPTNAPFYYLLFKILSLFLAFATALWLTLTVSALEDYLLILYVSAALVGWSFVDWVLQSIIKTRLEKVEKGLASALDLMLICVGAGLSFQKSMDRVAREIAPFNKEISKELAITSIELEILLDTRKALTNLTERVPSPIIKSFAMTMIQSIQQGTHVVKALDMIAKIIRQDRLQMAEVKAARLPSLLVIPLVLFTLPNIFIILLGPSLVRVLTVLKGS